ncbi:serine/threonine-protein kinase [Paraliomyxa miuraensis]|uniref:serine/threonine-protein kinase n=1 Tax=Paraliomyxa miuraensis TaxID=376150 RepID=UPI00225154E3|nr:serine/threonine-protein kinase [Paraliomyxa miuraensis]MCX4244492.1 serine/threonine protein kinase [Paraliomyxa miuraensis]
MSTDPTGSGTVARVVPRPEEITRPVDVPVTREHGLSGRLLPGTELRLEARVGKGASGEVYRATSGHAGPPLAVKVLCHRSTGSVRLRFHREVEILRQIDSPYVVKVVADGVLPDGRPWYAMEYIDGESLAAKLEATGRCEPAAVIAWIRGACRGLAAIHDAGWVHRDVKPANIIVLGEGAVDDVRIVDLGIAERIHSEPDLLSGTPEYIAPEQAEFRPVDVRSDVYALGCCAYELLTGRRLVEGRSAVAKINAHIEGVRPSWPNHPPIHPRLRRLVERCLARHPEARPPNVYVLEEELRRLVPGLARKAEPRRPSALAPRRGVWRHLARGLAALLGPRRRRAEGPEVPIMARARAG